MMKSIRSLLLLGMLMTVALTLRAEVEPPSGSSIQWDVKVPMQGKERKVSAI
jgi:hypothetical protein